MAYPLINGALINGTEGPATPGPPPGGFAFPAIGFSPIHYGEATLSESFAPQSFRPPTLPAQQVKFGTDITVKVRSLSRTRFGTPQVLRGMPPEETSYPAVSLVAGVFGTPSAYFALSVGPPEEMRPATFSGQRMAAGARPASLSPTTFGRPGIATGGQAASWRPARFGAHRLMSALQAKHGPRLRFGRPRAVLGGTSAHPHGLPGPVFGVPGPRGVALRARTVPGPTFGRPSIDRGLQC